jgi:hypothetical protein
MSELSKLVEGYPRLAGQIGQYPETAILRRFATLNSQNLLYLQAELIHLEEKIRVLEATANRSQSDNKRLYARDWYWLKASAESDDCELWQTVLEAKTKLKEYSPYLASCLAPATFLTITDDALLQQVTLSALPEPTPYSLRTLRHWLEAKHLGNLALIGEDQKIWSSDSQVTDLIVIRGYPEMDSFSKWIAEKFLVWFHHRFWPQMRKPGDLESGVAVYEDDKVLRYTSHTTTAVASLLPVVSSIILYRVQDVGVRLGLTALFTFIFGFCLAIFTNVQRREVFTAVAA